MALPIPARSKVLLLVENELRPLRGIATHLLIRLDGENVSVVGNELRPCGGLRHLLLGCGHGLAIASSKSS